MDKRRELGALGEKAAEEMLVAKGYAIVARNSRVADVEIDIIAMLGGKLVFVEVKTRRAGGPDPLKEIGRPQTNRLLRAMRGYMSTTGLKLEPQIDIVAVTVPHEEGAPLQVEHFPDAIRPGLRVYR